MFKSFAPLLIFVGKKNIRIKKKKKFQSYYCVLPASYYAYTCDKPHPRCRLPRNWFLQAE